MSAKKARLPTVLILVWVWLVLKDSNTYVTLQNKRVKLLKTGTATTNSINNKDQDYQEGKNIFKRSSCFPAFLFQFAWVQESEENIKQTEDTSKRKEQAFITFRVSKIISISRKLATFQNAKSTEAGKIHAAFVFVVDRNCAGVMLLDSSFIKT